MGLVFLVTVTYLLSLELSTASVNHLSLFCSAVQHSFSLPSCYKCPTLLLSTKVWNIRCALSPFFSFYMRKCPMLTFLSWSLSFLMKKQTFSFSFFLKIIFVFIILLSRPPWALVPLDLLGCKSTRYAIYLRFSNFHPWLVSSFLSKNVTCTFHPNQ